MLDFKKLKQSEIKKELIIDGEEVVVKNPTKEQKAIISQLLNGNINKDETKESTINVTMRADDIDIYRQFFVDLIEGVEGLPETKEEFAEVINNPSDEFKLILDEFYEILKGITLDTMKAQIREIDKKEQELLLGKGLNKVNNLMNKYNIRPEKTSVSINGSEPIKVFDDIEKKKEDITPRPKRKYNKKKKVEDVVVESKEGENLG